MWLSLGGRRIPAVLRHTNLSDSILTGRIADSEERMNTRLFLALVVSAIVAVLPLTGQTSSPGKKESSRATTKAWTMPRTPDGHPDLQGIWTNTTLTPLERNPDVARKKVLTEAEARAYEKQALDRISFDRRDGGTDVDVTRAYNNLFMDRGTQLAIINGERRTSIIVDPPDGRVPPLTPEASKRVDARNREMLLYDNYQNRPLAERCIVGQASTGGPPMLPGPYKQQLSDRSDSGIRDDSRRADPRRSDHSDGWTSASSFEHPPVDGRLAGPLARRYAGRRHHQFHGQDSVSRIERCLARDRAFHAHRCEHDPLPIHDRRSFNFCKALDWGVSASCHDRSDL